MKRKVLIALCLCMVGAAGMTTGCGSKKEETPVVEEKEPELKVIGQQEKDAFQVELKNATGKNIKGVAIKLTDEESYPDNMLKEGDIFADQESRNLYYKAPEDTTETSDAPAEETADTSESEGTEEKALEQGYDIQITFEDDSTAELHSFPFEDIEKGDLCYADDVAYVTYTSISTKEEMDTKEAELAVKAAAEQKAAEEAAQAEAEQKAAEEAAAQAAAEQAAAEQKAAEEAAAAAAAQQKKSYSSSAGSNSSSGSSSTSAGESYSSSSDAGSSASDSSGDDGCLDDGLLY